MFKMIDTDNSGHITLEELKKGLERVGADLKDAEIINLMEAVSYKIEQSHKPERFNLIKFDLL